MSKVIKTDLKLLIINFFERNNISYSEKTFLLAVSGGVDSMVLLRLFAELKINFVVAHCNFKLRGNDSDADEEFVKKQCDTKNIKLFNKEFETKKIARSQKKSIQELARDLRYSWFKELFINNKIDYLVTAHHLNDSVETTLFNLIRGTGVKGLLGIAPNKNNLLRPLIEISKDEILNYAKLNKIRYREDKSNLKNDYSRNYIRNVVLNSLEQKIPNSIHGIHKTSNNLYGLSKLLEQQLLSWKSTYFKQGEDRIQQFRIFDFIKNEPLHKYFLFDLLQEFELNHSSCIEILEATNNQKRGLVWNSENYNFTLNKENLCIKAKTIPEFKSVFFKKSVQLNGVVIKIASNKNSFKDIDFKALGANKVVVDKDKLSFPLEIRIWKNGDVFYPFGIKGKKKLSDFFIDRKLSKFEKEKVLLLCSNGDIVWIIGMAADRRFSAEPNSKNLVSIQIN